MMKMFIFILFFAMRNVMGINIQWQHFMLFMPGDGVLRVWFMLPRWVLSWQYDRVRCLPLLDGLQEQAIYQAQYDEFLGIFYYW